MHTVWSWKVRSLIIQVYILAFKTYHFLIATIMLPFCLFILYNKDKVDDVYM